MIFNLLAGACLRSEVCQDLKRERRSKPLKESFQFSPEPSLRQLPIAFDGGMANTQYFGCFLY